MTVSHRYAGKIPGELWPLCAFRGNRSVRSDGTLLVQTGRQPSGGVPVLERQHEEGIVAKTMQTYNGYCVKCKEKRDFEGNVEISKTGMRMAKGKCPVCGTTVNRILGKA
jgi:uncharacterized protein DUF5679